jgi:hypothetical protein
VGRRGYLKEPTTPYGEIPGLAGIVTGGFEKIFPRPVSGTVEAVEAPGAVDLEDGGHLSAGDGR